MKPPISPQRLAANRANAGRSTGPQTPEGKARSSQNARKHSFNPGNFAVVRIEDAQTIANLRDDAIAVYQPVNSQEMYAVERIALAQQAMLRMSMLEPGLFTNCLDDAMEGPGKPYVLDQPELTNGIQIAPGQNRAFWLGFGFHRIAANVATRSCRPAARKTAAVPRPKRTKKAEA